jgi:hypothetical protein
MTVTPPARNSYSPTPSALVCQLDADSWHALSHFFFLGYSSWLVCSQPSLSVFPLWILLFTLILETEAAQEPTLTRILTCTSPCVVWKPLISVKLVYFVPRSFPYLVRMVSYPNCRLTLSVFNSRSLLSVTSCSILFMDPVLNPLVCLFFFFI